MWLEGEPQDCVGGLLAGDFEEDKMCNNKCDVQVTRVMHKVKDGVQGGKVDKSRLGHYFVFFGPSS